LCVMFYFQSVPTVPASEANLSILVIILHTTLSTRWFRLQVCVCILLKCNKSILYVKQRLRNNYIISYYLFLFQLRHMYSTISRKYLFTKFYNGKIPECLSLHRNFNEPQSNSIHQVFKSLY
jgi:hypothetical protein